MSTKYLFNRHPRSVFIFFIFFLLLIPCAIELILYQFLHHPSLNLSFPYLHKTVAYIYYEHELDFLQYLPQCAEYDNQLLYILKPGSCQHHSIEFDCTYSINKMGLRDDDASLIKPEIIVLGDSYAMGWGMDNKQIFPSLLEDETSKKTLNVSVSSYGTAREFILLDRLGISNMKYLIIQYCTNDFDENREYVENEFKLKIESRKFYETIVRNHVSRVKYRPFLYLSTLLRVLQKRLFGRNDSKETKHNVARAGFNDSLSTQLLGKNSSVAFSSEDSARYFLEILKSHNYLDSVKIIVMNISGPLYTTPSFIQTLAKIKNDESYPAFIKNMSLIDICDYVKRDDYFILDNHLNKEGHLKVADLLIEAIKSNESSSAFSNGE